MKYKQLSFFKNVVKIYHILKKITVIAQSLLIS